MKMITHIGRVYDYHIY